VATKGKKVVRAERAIKFVKERYQCVKASLPYKLPIRLIGDLVTYVTRRINVLPRRTHGPVSSVIVRAILGAKV
jgi:hypothetical protein